MQRGADRAAAQRLVLERALAFFSDAPPSATDGDLFADVAAIEWPRVEPLIFGSVLQASMDRDERHAFGVHFTEEADIQRVVEPTLVRPWRERIAAAQTARDMEALHRELSCFRVLDPACGTGNFLYVAYRELVRLEAEILNRLPSSACAASRVSLAQLRGIDIDPFAVEIAKATLAVAERRVRGRGAEVAIEANIVCGDALLDEWPDADAIIGNPPYQSKNRMQEELGAAYVRRVRERYPGVPGGADYCVYWFRRAHDGLPAGGRAGFVATNTIRQNRSREGGLDYIVANGGTLVEAIATQVWPGEAAVHVSMVSWVKGEAPGKKVLSWQEGDSIDSPWARVEVDAINTALSPATDVTSARPLRVNTASGACHQGQTHGHAGFLVSPDEARAMIEASSDNANVLFPFMTGRDLVSRPDAAPSRWVIDFHPKSAVEAAAFEQPFRRIERDVLPHRKKAAARERERNRGVPEERANRHHALFLKDWWQLSWPRPELIRTLASLPRYCVCARVTKRPVFEMISSRIRPGDALQVFALADDYSFGVLQSSMHWRWLVARCSTLKRDYRYTSTSVFDSFPWPQAPSLANVCRVAGASVELRAVRRAAMETSGKSRRELYRCLEGVGKGPLEDAHRALDEAVRAAYSMPAKDDVLAFLLAANADLAAREARGDRVIGPGLPAGVEGVSGLVSDDCVEP